MKIYKIIVALFLIISACETIVEIEIPLDSPSFVVNSTLVDNEFIQVSLSESQHILDASDYITISGATVEIYENDILLETLPDSLSGKYISNINKAKSGSNYKIKVDKTGFETASSEVLIPLDTAQIVSIKMDTVVENEFGYTSHYLRFSVEIEDKGAIDNYYEISLYQKYYHQRYDYSVDPPVYIDSVLVYQKQYIQSRDPSLEEFQNWGESIVFNDELFNGSTYRMNVLMPTWVDFESEQPLDYKVDFYIELANTSESYYNYELSSQLQYWTEDNPFAQPVTVYNNIENGFGVFGAYNTAVVKVE